MYFDQKELGGIPKLPARNDPAEGMIACSVTKAGHPQARGVVGRGPLAQHLFALELC
jgi:hypothetical protein